MAQDRVEESRPAPSERRYFVSGLPEHARWVYPWVGRGAAREVIRCDCHTVPRCARSPFVLAPLLVPAPILGLFLEKGFAMSLKNGRKLRSILGLGVVLILSLAVMAPQVAQGGTGLGHPKVRWDFVQIGGAGPTLTGLPGGTDIGRDAATGDTVELTASGIVVPFRGDVTGGGTFLHKHADGSVFARGFYVLTGFVSWERRPGTFPLPNDGVGHLANASAGVLVVNIRAFPDGGPSADGVLTIFCHFPDTPGPNDEGFTLDVASFHFVQAGGITLFHVFR